MRARPFLAALAIGAAAWAAASSAFADIYGYIDEEGIAHFSAEQLDARYQLFMRGDAPVTTSELKQGPAAQVAPATAGTQTIAKSPLFGYLSQHPNLKKYEPLLDRAAKEFDLEPALLKAVMAAESGFNPNAVSPKGAVGLMQVMPATAQRYGLQPDKKKSVAQKLADPWTNIRLGARYLRDLHRMFPAKPHLVLASYNAGEGAVQKYSNTVPPYPETRNYVQLVTQFYQLYKPSAPALSVATGMRIDSSGSSESGSDAYSAAKRIRITIPGRQNMPASNLE
jgi:soluble lytic murein transglycosylase-like protein